MLSAVVVVARPVDYRVVFPDEIESRFSLNAEDDKEIFLPFDDLAALRVEDEPDGLALEYGEFFQGDIALTDEQKLYLLDDSNNSLLAQHGRIDEIYHWPKDDDGLVRVPFYLSPSSKFCKLNFA